MSKTVFVMNFMTNMQYEDACDDNPILDISHGEAATPSFQSISLSGDDAWISECKRLVEAELISEDEDLYDDGDEIGEYLWEDGQWGEPGDGRDNRVYKVTQDGGVAAYMVIQRLEPFN